MLNFEDLTGHTKNLSKLSEKINVICFNITELNGFYDLISQKNKGKKTAIIYKLESEELYLNLLLDEFNNIIRGKIFNKTRKNIIAKYDHIIDEWSDEKGKCFPKFVMGVKIPKGLSEMQMSSMMSGFGDMGNMFDIMNMFSKIGNINIKK